MSSELSTAQQRAVAELFRVAPVADDLGRRFARAGHELHLVGGSVRDALLGRLGADLDFATDAKPDAVLAIAAGWAESVWTTGIDFGTVGMARRGFRLEVTTYRADRYDRVSRNPTVTYGSSLDDDLRRRDFAVNAMAISVPDHRWSDPYGGLTDLLERCCAPHGSSRRWASCRRPTSWRRLGRWPFRSLASRPSGYRPS